MIAYANRLVAVTGSRGFIGCELTRALLQAGARPLLVNRRPHPPAPGARTLVADLREPGPWDEIVRADIVFHLAGNTSANAAAADPAESFRSTMLPITHLIAAAQDCRRSPRIVYASTATVYGLTAHLPVSEVVPPNPITVYDLHKWSAEQLLAQASSDGILDGVSLRLPNVYGPSAGASSADDRGVLNSIAKRALQGTDLSLYGSGGCLRDYVYIDDVVAAFLAAGAATGLTARTFNVASGRGVPVRDAFHMVVERAAMLTGVRSRVREVPWPADADPIELRSFAGDITRMTAATGWAPRISLEDGIDRLLGTASRQA